MATTPQQIDLWRSAPSEHQRLEFKEAKNQFDNRKLCEYCVALANEGGGHLLLGVADTPPRAVVGTAAFNDPVAMAEKLFEAVGFRVDIEAVAHPDGRVLVFHIPSRPRGTAYHLDGKYLMRSGEALVPMSEDQLRRIFAEGGPDWVEEHSKTGLDGQQVVELLDTQTFFELLKLPYPH
jgi:ATP-dependent DNA helicase RecG